MRGLPSLAEMAYFTVEAPPPEATPMPVSTTIYQADFVAWTQDQARRLRAAAEARVNLPLDFENIAEELEDMGRSQADALNSALTRILEHLLKLEYSSATAPRDGWEESVNEHRDRASRALVTSLSLRTHIDLEDAYRRGRAFAARSLARDGVAASQLAADCPYPLERVLDIDWWPVSRHGLE